MIVFFLTWLQNNHFIDLAQDEPLSSYIFFKVIDNKSHFHHDVAHWHLSYDREGFMQEHKKCYSVRVEGGFLHSHNLTGHGKQALY